MDLYEETGDSQSQMMICSIEVDEDIDDIVWIMNVNRFNAKNCLDFEPIK